MQRPLRSINVTCSGGVIVTMRNQTQDTIYEHQVKRWLSIKHPDLEFVACDEAEPDENEPELDEDDWVGIELQRHRSEG